MVAVRRSFRARRNTSCFIRFRALWIFGIVGYVMGVV